MSPTKMPKSTLDSPFCLDLSDQETELVKGGIQQTQPALASIPPKPQPLVLLFANPFSA